MKIAICSGGTGGHIFPACALFEAAKSKGHGVQLITDVRGAVFCENIPDSDKIVFSSLRFSLRRIWTSFVSLCNFFVIFFRCLFVWRKLPPDAVVGFGGIFTIAPIIAAKILGAKVIVYEQNSVIGRANKFLSLIADLKLANFDLSKGGWSKIAALVRSEFLVDAPYKCDGKIRILAISGSQGAKSFCKIIPEALARLDRDICAHIEIVQQESYGNIEKLQQIYDHLGVKAKIKKFITNVAKIMGESQLVICRAGASTLSELVAMGRPAILIPFPEAMDNHQFQNAMHLQSKEAAWVIEEGSGVVEKLAHILHEISHNRNLLKTAAANMLNKSAKDAANIFVSLIEKIGEK